MPEYTRIGGQYLQEQILLQSTTTAAGTPGLEITADVGDEETTVTLELEGVRRLRLALQAFERKQR